MNDRMTKYKFIETEIEPKAEIISCRLPCRGIKKVNRDRAAKTVAFLIILSTIIFLSVVSLHEYTTKVLSQKNNRIENRMLLFICCSSLIAFN